MHDLADAVRPRGRRGWVVHCAMALAGLLAMGKLCAASGVPVRACSHQDIEAQATVDVLRAHLDTCGDPGPRSFGIARLNASEPPQPGEKFRMQTDRQGEAVQTLYSARVLFAPDQAYLTDAEFDSLDQVIRDASQASQVLSVSLVGRGDLMETMQSYPRNIGLLRARHVLKYLRAAGLPQTVPVTLVQGFAEASKTAEDRVKGRHVIVHLTALRVPPSVDAPAVATIAPGRRRGLVVAPSIARVGKDVMSGLVTATSARERLHSEVNSTNAAVLQELERLKSQLSARLDEGMHSTRDAASVTLLTEVDADGKVQQVWVGQSRGALTAAQRMMELALATPELGPVSDAALAAGAQRLLVRVEWEGNLPPPGTLVYESFRPPVYPLRAKLKGLQGEVQVRAQVQPDGYPTQVKVARSSGHAELDQAAVESVQQSVFFPTRMPGPVSDTVPVRFALEPSADSYASRVQRLVRPYIVVPEKIPGNPMAEVEVRLSQDGAIQALRLVSPSGNAQWDTAVLRALRMVQRVPADMDGNVPPRLSIGFRPKN